MNEDYLWDKSGDVDPEIELLERKLSMLRYKRPATPLALPVRSPWFFRRSFSPALRLAATLVLLVLAGGLWFALHRTSNYQGNQLAAGTKPEANQSKGIVSGPPPTTGQPVDPTAGTAANKDNEQLTLPASPRKIYRRAPVEQQPQRLAAIQTVNNSRRAALREQKIRGEEAKAQLILALHIASDKLNTVQKKIQGNQEGGPIS